MEPGTATEHEALVELLPPEYTRPVALTPFWAAVVPKALGGEFIKLLQALCPLGPQHLHLKRARQLPAASARTAAADLAAAVAPLADAGGGLLQVLVCPEKQVPDASVVAFLAASGCAACARVQVSEHPALTRGQLSDFSRHWPLNYRRPSFEPLELPAEARGAYARWLRRAEEVGRGRCGCIVVDRAGAELAAAADGTDSHPLRHAAMAAIGAVAARLEAARRGPEAGAATGSKRPRAEEEYLCQDCTVVTTHEPCVMCAMALAHSRVSVVAYHAPDPGFGGLGGRFALHLCHGLNHKLRVLRWPNA